jgi:hypothetical protein
MQSRQHWHAGMPFLPVSWSRNAVGPPSDGSTVVGSRCIDVLSGGLYQGRSVVAVAVSVGAV